MRLYTLLAYVKLTETVTAVSEVSNQAMGRCNVVRVIAAANSRLTVN